MVKSKTYNLEDFSRGDFQKICAEFDRLFGPNWPEVPLRKWEYVNAILFSDILSKPRSINILEAGSGCSVFTPFLAKNGFTVHEFDIGYEKMRESRNYKMNIADKVSEYTMNLMDIEFDDEEFDIIFSLSAIEHVNAGRYADPSLPFDVGDSKAMAELERVLKPGGILVLTTDFAEKYYPPPGLWKDPCHRIYDENSIFDRLIAPTSLKFWGEIDFSIESDINLLEPEGYDYTVAIVSLVKP